MYFAFTNFMFLSLDHIMTFAFRKSAAIQRALFLIQPKYIYCFFMVLYTAVYIVIYNVIYTLLDTVLNIVPILNLILYLILY